MRKNGRDSVFLISAIRATELTQTGWTAKIAAASHAPGIFNRTSKREQNRAEGMQYYVDYMIAGSMRPP